MMQMAPKIQCNLGTNAAHAGKSQSNELLIILTIYLRKQADDRPECSTYSFDCYSDVSMYMYIYPCLSKAYC
jgi:hypothetical protein